MKGGKKAKDEGHRSRRSLVPIFPRNIIT